MQPRGIAGVILCTVALAIAGFAVSASAQGKIRLAQSSVTTTCMMTCNGQYANCQSSCLTIGTQQQSSPSGTIAGANANPNQTCIAGCTNQQLQSDNLCALVAVAVTMSAIFRPHLNCTTQQISCQTACARTSPSQ
jgi:hypothetical protein